MRLIVNTIEPDHGVVLDPACGSAGMFVQTGHFIEEVRQQTANHQVMFYGQEKSDTNTKLARMNLVVHGLDASNIHQGNTFYDKLEGLKRQQPVGAVFLRLLEPHGAGGLCHGF